MKLSSKFETLPFDQFSRQSQVFEIIESLRTKDQSFTILDVGGYRGVTREMHSKDKVTVLDIFDVKEKGYVQGSGLALPFEDESFDFVVSFDVFEHIENKDRQKFLAESARVAKIAVITAAPVATETNVQAEKYLNDLYKRMHGNDHPWLTEHIEYGIPKVGQAQGIFKDLQLHTMVLPSNDVSLWTAMQGAIFLNSKYGAFPEDIAKLNEFYNHTAPNDGTEDPLHSYRHIVLGFKSDATGKKVEKYLGERTTTLTASQKVDISERLNEHYRLVLKQYQIQFDKKVTEVDFLQRTIDNVAEERDKYKRELETIKLSRSYKLFKKAGSIKRRIKK